jgi:NAD(P)-dependent dehydrogenase (short-subunit alcohol dehydrogenase family)
LKRFDLAGRSAVVTAGGTGMGYYMARGLARSGARVLIASRREKVLIESAQRLRQESGGEILHLRVDLRDRASICAFTAKAIEMLGGVDVFLGNAATSQEDFQMLDTVTDASIDSFFQINVSSIIEMMRAFLPHMRKQKWGRIILSSSTTSLTPLARAGMCLYTATKGALNSLARTAAAEAGHDGITVNAVLFGMYMTEMSRDYVAHLNQESPGAGKAFMDAIASMTALGRIGLSDEPEGIIQFLASNASSYITGANIVADGGHSIMGQPSPPPESPAI